MIRGWDRGRRVRRLRRRSLARPQGRRSPLLHRARIAPRARQICSHCRGFAHAGGIMLPQKSGGCALDLTRAAVTRVTGIRENLRRRFAGVQVRLCLRRDTARREHHTNRPGSRSMGPQHHGPPTPAGFWPFCSLARCALGQKVRITHPYQPSFYSHFCRSCALPRRKDFVLIRRRAHGSGCPGNTPLLDAGGRQLCRGRGALLCLLQ